MFTRAPPSAVARQTPMSYAYGFESMYPDIPLPASLADVRIKFLDESTGVTLRDFYFNLLLSLRSDLVLVSHFLKDVLSRSQPPPGTHKRSARLQALFLSVSHCQFCGQKFDETRVTRTGKRIKIKRQFDHDHFLQARMYLIVVF